MAKRNLPGLAGLYRDQAGEGKEKPIPWTEQFRVGGRMRSARKNVKY